VQIQGVALPPSGTAPLPDMSSGCWCPLPTQGEGRGHTSNGVHSCHTSCGQLHAHMCGSKISSPAAYHKVGGVLVAHDEDGDTAGDVCTSKVLQAPAPGVEVASNSLCLPGSAPVQLSVKGTC
jgi:hypothetical protein